jgi:hypothetical protein
MPIDLPPPPPPGSGSGIDLPPPPAPEAKQEEKPKERVKPSFWDPEMTFAGAVAGGAVGFGKGLGGSAMAAKDMVMGLGTVVGHAIDASGEPDPEYDRLRNEWFGTKPIYDGIKSFRQAYNEWHSMPQKARDEILRKRLEEEQGKSAFGKSFDQYKALGDFTAGMTGPGLAAKAVGDVRKGVQLGTELQNINKANERLMTLGTMATREAQLSQGERIKRQTGEVSEMKRQAELVKLQQESTAHQRVKTIHGVEFPESDHSLTPTNEQLEPKLKHLVINQAQDVDRIRSEAGKVIKAWEDELDVKQQVDPKGFWRSPEGWKFRRETLTRLGKIIPKPGMPKPKWSPTPEQVKIVTQSFERIKGFIPAGGKTVVPVHAKDLAGEIKRIGSEIGKEIKSNPGSQMIGYLEEYQESLVKSLEEYVGKDYPAQQYADAMIDKRVLFHDLGIKEKTITPGRKVYTTTTNAGDVFKDPEKFRALRLHIGDDAADNLALHYLSNNLAGKSSTAARDWLRSQRWFSEASPNAYEMADTYVDSLAREEGNYDALLKSAKDKESEIDLVKKHIEKMGTDRTSILGQLKTTLTGKTGPEMQRTYQELRPELQRSGALTPEQINELDDNVQRMVKIQTTAERNKMIAKTIARMGGYGAATYEFGRFMHFLGK